jgi:hypothetical protein
MKKGILLALILVFILVFVCFRFYFNEIDFIRPFSIKTNTDIKLSESTSSVKQNNSKKNDIDNLEPFSQYEVRHFRKVTLKNIYKIKEDKKYKLADENGNDITKPIYNDIQPIDESGLYYLTNINKKYGVISYNGKVILPAKYVEIIPQANKFVCIIKNNSYYGLYDIKKNKLLLPLIYDKIESLSNYNWVINYSKKAGLYHYKDGNHLVIKPIFDNILRDNYFIRIINKGKNGIVDLQTGEILLDSKYDTIDLLNSSNAFLTDIYIYRTQTDNRYGVAFHSNKGTIIIPPIYTDVTYKGLVHVVSDGNTQILDNEGNIMKPENKNK